MSIPAIMAVPKHAAATHHIAIIISTLKNNGKLWGIQKVIREKKYKEKIREVKKLRYKSPNCTKLRNAVFGMKYIFYSTIHGKI